MSGAASGDRREGSLEAPARHPIDWKDPAFYDEGALLAEMERVFDICHGCRRCFNLCRSFPTLFDLVDESATMEVDGVSKDDYWSVVDQCYLCDLCFMTKCPYVPPHEWNVDFPHLMLRAKAVHAKQGRTGVRDRLLTSTDFLGSVVARPGIAPAVNAANRSRPLRTMLEKTLGVHRDAWLPPWAARRASPSGRVRPEAAAPTERTTGKVAIFSTCYGRANEPRIVAELTSVLEHNAVAVVPVIGEVCCGMPKLELGDLDAVERLKELNLPRLLSLVESGFDLLAPVPSCVLMFKQELPLLFAGDPAVARVAKAFFDPFEYLALRHQGGRLRTDFRHSLGKVAYHVACHQRVQNIGAKTREILELVPDSRIDTIERCSGHDGTYAVKVEFHPSAAKIARPIANRIRSGDADWLTSDCPMAAHHIAHCAGDGREPVHPLALLRHAYGLTA